MGMELSYELFQVFPLVLRISCLFWLGENLFHCKLQFLLLFLLLAAAELKDCFWEVVPWKLLRNILVDIGPRRSC